MRNHNVIWFLGGQHSAWPKSAVQEVLVEYPWILNKMHLKLRIRGGELVIGSGPEPE